MIQNDSATQIKSCQSLGFKHVFFLACVAFSGGALASAPPPADAEANYQRVCADCHDKGSKEKLAKGAPRLGDYKAWESRLSKGVDSLYGKLIDGKQHGKPDDPVWQKANPFIWRDDLSEAQIRGTLEYMFMKADE